MLEAMNYMRIFQIIFVIAILLLLLFFCQQIHLLQLEKRFMPFSLQTTYVKEKSFFDKISELFWKITNRLTKILKKSSVIRKVGKKYDKYVNADDIEIKQGISYIAIKLEIAILLCFLYTITLSLQSYHVHVIGYLLVSLFGYFIPDFFLELRFKMKRKKIEEDLLKAIMMMNNSFKSGKNIMQAISTVKNNLDGPIADEFKKIYLDITYGLSLEVVFNRFYERVELEDAKYIATSLTLLNKTGGNIVRVFAMIEKSILNRKKLREEVSSLTAASIFVFRVLVLLPFIFALIIYILNPLYFQPLFTSKLGMFFFILLIFLFSIYIFIINKVLKVKL